MASVDGDSHCVRVRVPSNGGAPDRYKQLAVGQVTDMIATAAADGTLVPRRGPAGRGGGDPAWFPPGPGSDGGAAAVGGEDRAGDVAGLGRGEEGDDLGDLARLGGTGEQGRGSEGGRHGSSGGWRRTPVTVTSKAASRRAIWVPMAPAPTTQAAVRRVSGRRALPIRLARSLSKLRGGAAPARGGRLRGGRRRARR